MTKTATKPKPDKWFGWHFLSANKRLRYGDGRTVRAGRIYRTTFPYQGYSAPSLCNAGMHASARAIDALQYAPGAVVCFVELRGSITESGDKAVARARKVIWMADATRTLHEFAVWAARRALMREQRAGREPDARSWAALKAKRDWLVGKITDGELGAAWDAAWDAARGAAWDAARGAAWGAEIAIQNKELTRRLMLLAPVKR